jgi:hypothetical protein
MPASPEQWTIAGLLVAIGIAGAARQWVFGWVYKAMERERDFYRSRYFGAIGLAEIASEHLPRRSRRRAVLSEEAGSMRSLDDDD